MAEKGWKLWEKFWTLKFLVKSKVRIYVQVWIDDLTCDIFDDTKNDVIVASFGGEPISAKGKFYQGVSHSQ